MSAGGAAAVGVVLEIDGARFDDLAGLCAEMSTRVFVGDRWNGNLDALTSSPWGM